MNKVIGELYWDEKRQKIYSKVISSKLGPQHEKVVVLIPDDGSESQQFTLDFFNRLVNCNSIVTIKTAAELELKKHKQQKSL
jgi:hypothetical protein